MINFNETIKKYNYVVFVCRTVEDFVSFRKVFKNEFWCSDRGYEEAEKYILGHGDISFGFIDGVYDGFCYEMWFRARDPWNIVYWTTYPTFIEVDE
jgi:hypothetical protein